MTTPPVVAQDYDRLTADGFVYDNTWFHGTSSGLLENILQQGLKRSGDAELETALHNTMTTIGDRMTDHQEPVFLCPAKSLAWYWALQTVRKRHSRLGNDEEPVILAVTLGEDSALQVLPDVGAASILMHPEGEDYLAYLSGIYHERDLPHPSLNPVQADRLDYLKKLGLAYCNADIGPEYLQLVTR
ncbi:hypothetical protein [Pseudomaricurvus sp. HS19]|uniref:hypothetical protein n=1 Tax=Pseudomaricurvus sp. HS19 TaxID=2692626 RepID=UPI00136D48A2|nr:hypothetical protein [Pseudomaricurvus sp. HS19]MYM62456.1 hypothetical protein [Pseudomaricurvus sp. HS19]